MNDPASLYYPIIYVAGAALVLGGGVLAMVTPGSVVPGLLAATVGTGMVVAATIIQALRSQKGREQ